MANDNTNEKINPTLKWVITAVMAALSCIATMVIQVPTVTGGYTHVGDIIVLFSGFLLGPVYGALAAGVGSAMADLITGYVHYIPGTLIIKAMVAFVAAVVYYGLDKIVKKPDSRMTRALIRGIIASVLAEIVMVIGYFFYKWIILGSGLAAGIDTILGNLGQAFVGIVGAIVLLSAFEKDSHLRKYLKMFR